ncbi:hypothetical protein FYK55_19000 [Roseiconus nitratireducens]|uniref:Uncharacterized protein n=1 Tax=Roseiconus nitratireducens TaxID=2605748 RepID=A0A5M6D331_9BACT|nr:hypothetical protein [Roseiconus nitratireducens]KAA5540990.1 hypothetical protein FYK55_19000 [Roseiconus nitratireducens]
MNRPWNLMLLSLGVILSAAVLAEPAAARHESPLERAADCYRETVRDFERHVLRARYIERTDERLVDDLEDSTSRLRSATRNLRRLDRLFESYVITQRLHYRVQSTLFEQGLYPPDRDLVECWSRVARTFGHLETEMRCFQDLLHGHESPVHGGGGYQPVPVPVPTYVPVVPHYGADSIGPRGATPTFLPESFGPRPALQPRSARPALQQRAPRPALVGALLQRRLD